MAIHWSARDVYSIVTNREYDPSGLRGHLYYYRPEILLDSFHIIIFQYIIVMDVNVSARIQALL